MPCTEIEKHNCAACNRNTVIVARENKCEYRLINKYKEKICKVKIDGCYIQEGRKCDFLILRCEKKIAYFIELKGSSYFDAVAQIMQTIDKLMDITNQLESVNARIVLTKVSVPNLKNNPKILRLEKS
ncbi:hypothetical protein [Desulfonema limicola]|nr:hypothetical protein [Desulfonema limicola]